MTNKKKRFPWSEWEFGVSRYEAGVYPVPPFRSEATKAKTACESDDNLGRKLRVQPSSSLAEGCVIFFLLISVCGQNSIIHKRKLFRVLLDASVSLRPLAEREGTDHSDLDRQDATTSHTSTGGTYVTERLSRSFVGLSKLRQ